MFFSKFCPKKKSITDRIPIYPIFLFISDLRYFFSIDKENLGRGYLHAKNLGKGGEYLSYIWMLLWRMGMETLADKMQRAPDLPEKEDDGASGGGAEINDTTSTTLAKTIIGDENEKAEPQEVEGSNDGTARTTSPATVISDEKRDEDDVSHGATSAATATPHHR